MILMDTGTCPEYRPDAEDFRDLTPQWLTGHTMPATTRYQPRDLCSHRLLDLPSKIRAEQTEEPEPL